MTHRDEATNGAQTAAAAERIHDHHYATRLSWDGSTAVGYQGYRRAHRVEPVPAATALELSADPAFHGDPASINPEQLLVAAASSCQLLSFLAVAARARIDVIGYTDEATAIMPDRPHTSITRIELHPVITVRGSATDERLQHLVEIGHRECYIANSLTSQVVVQPTFRHV